LIRLVSYFLIVSMLRLQFVFCTCGVVGHFDPTGESASSISCCHEECQHKPGTLPVENDQVTNLTAFCGDCDHNDPIRAHSHQIQPKTDDSNRLSASWIISARNWTWLKSTGIQRRFDPRWNERWPFSQLALLNLLAHLRI